MEQYDAVEQEIMESLNTHRMPWEMNIGPIQRTGRRVSNQVLISHILNKLNASEGYYRVDRQEGGLGPAMNQDFYVDKGSFFLRRMYIDLGSTDVSAQDCWLRMILRPAIGSPQILLELNSENGGLDTIRSAGSKKGFIRRLSNPAETVYAFNDSDGEPHNQPGSLMRFFANTGLMQAIPGFSAVYDVEAIPYILEPSFLIEGGGEDFDSLAIDVSYDASTSDDPDESDYVAKITASGGATPFSEVQAGDFIKLYNCTNSDNDGVAWVRSATDTIILLEFPMLEDYGWGRDGADTTGADETACIKVFGRPVRIDTNLDTPPMTFSLKKTDSDEDNYSSIEVSSGIFQTGSYSYVDEYGESVTSGNRLDVGDTVIISGSESSKSDFESHMGHIGGANASNVYTVRSATNTKIVLNEPLTISSEAGSSDLIDVTWPVIKKVNPLFALTLMRGKFYFNEDI